MFVQTAPTGWELILVRDITLEYCGYLFAAIVTVAEAAVQLFRPEVGVVDRWSGAWYDAERALSELQR
jgi:hypothetical protein